MKVIHLTNAEKQSGYDRINFAEDLIRQLPVNHYEMAKKVLKELKNE